MYFPCIYWRTGTSLCWQIVESGINCYDNKYSKIWLETLWFSYEYRYSIVYWHPQLPKYYRIEEISLKIFSLLKVIENISPHLNLTTSCQVAHKTSLRIFLHSKIKSALSAKKKDCTPLLSFDMVMFFLKIRHHASICCLAVSKLAYLMWVACVFLGVTLNIDKTLRPWSLLRFSLFFVGVCGYNCLCFINIVRNR